MGETHVCRGFAAFFRTLEACLRQAQPFPGVIENSIGIKPVLLQPGSFTMGEPGEKDLLLSTSSHRLHQVTLTRPFLMSVYEATNAQWKMVMG